MTDEFSAVIVARSGDGCLGFGWQYGLPRAFLIGDKLHAGLDFLQSAGIDDPDYLATCFFGFVLHADDIADLEVFFDAVDAGSGAADVLGGGVLEERLLIGAHAPHFHPQVQSRARS